MIIREGTTVWSLLRSHWKSLTAVLTISFVVEFLSDTGVFDRPALTVGSLGLLTGTLTIYLVFRVNEAYERWWEARKLWGSLVNESRNFARQVLTMLTADRVSGIADADEERQVQTQLLHRHIAYVHALRLHLRGEQDWSDATKLLSGPDADALAEAVNKPAYLVRFQAESLRGLLGPGPAEQLVFNQIDSTLSSLFHIQGGCERIKNTVFPAAITKFSRILVWAIAVLIPIAIVESDSQLDVLEAGVVALMSCSIVLINELGQDLKNPFENQPNDTAMTSLSTSIEIDLRQMLGETDLPEPIQPEKGVLM